MSTNKLDTLAPIDPETDGENKAVRYAVVAPNGGILRVGVCSLKSVRLQIEAGSDNALVIGVPDPITDLSHYWDGQSFVEYLVPRPSLHHRWIGGEWVDPRTPEDVASGEAEDRSSAFDALRIERDRLLIASDWTQVPDAPLTEAQREAWRIYRQVLRDMPETTEDPAEPIWPAKP